MVNITFFGVLGEQSVEIDDDGFLEIPVIVSNSPFFAGTSPPELRITEIGVYGDDAFNRRYTAERNRRSNYTYFLTKAKIKIISPLEIVSDEMILNEGLLLLTDQD